MQCDEQTIYFAGPHTLKGVFFWGQKNSFRVEVRITVSLGEG